MKNILKEIVKEKKNEVKILKNKFSYFSIEETIRDRTKTRNFSDALKKINDKKYNIIAEIKRASPSRGIIRKEFDPVLISKQYTLAGACCLSVLTDKKWFDGDKSFISLIKQNTPLPILRKDFIIDPIQVYESKIIDADCILLIMSILSDEQAKELEELAISLEMSVLIEVHDEKELFRALSLTSNLIGINNRNLKNMTVNIETSKKLLPLIPKSKIGISESGLKSNLDLKLLSNFGANSFLIGESLMNKHNLTNATKKLIAKI